MEEELFPDGTIEVIDGKPMYIRSVSQSRQRLEDAFLEYYGVSSKTHSAYVFPSGMSAISSVLHSFSTPNGPIVLGEELYSDTPHVAERLIELKRASKIVLANAYKGNVQEGVCLVETVSNPTGIVADLADLAKKKRGTKMVLCVDNTWLSGASFSPFKTSYGDEIDVVLESCSKYISGGACIAGMAVVRKDLANTLFAHIRHHGLHVSNHVCDLLLQTLPSVSQRISNSVSNTESVIKSIAKGVQVLYPAISNEWKYGPSVITILVDHPNPILGNSKSSIMRELPKLCTAVGLAWETSFGSSHSRLDCWPKILEKERKVLLRFAVGYKQGEAESIIEFINKLMVKK